MRPAPIPQNPNLQVSEDIDELAFNTAISALMVLTNHLMTFEKPPREALEVTSPDSARPHNVVYLDCLV